MAKKCNKKKRPLIKANLGMDMNSLLLPLVEQMNSSSQSLNEYGVAEDTAQNNMMNALEGGLNPGGAVEELIGGKAGSIASSLMPLVNLLPGGALIGAGIGAGAGALANGINEDKNTAAAKKKEFNNSRVKAMNSTLANISGAQYTKPTFELGGDIDEIQGNTHENGGTNIGNLLEAEKGETIHSRFIFSDEINIDDSHIEQYPEFEGYKGKSVAEVSKKIDKEFSLRKNDSFDTKEKDKRMANLKVVQEMSKLQMKAKETSNALRKAFGDNNRTLKQFNLGGPYEREDKLQVEGYEDYTYGDFYDFLGEEGISKYLPEQGDDFKIGSEHLKALEDSKFKDFMDLKNYNPEESDYSKALLTERPGFDGLENLNIGAGLEQDVARIQTNQQVGPLSGGLGDAVAPISEGLGNIGNKAIDYFKDDINRTSLIANMGNVWDIGRGIHGLLKPEKEFDRANPQQINPSFLDPTRGIQDINLAFSGAENAVSNTAQGGSYLANRLGLASSKAKATSGLLSQIGNQNAVIGNQAKQFNAQQRDSAQNVNLGQQRYEELINQQERDVASNMVQGGLSNMGEISTSLLRDRRLEQRDDFILDSDLIGSGMFTLDREGSIILKKNKGN